MPSFEVAEQQTVEQRSNNPRDLWYKIVRYLIELHSDYLKFYVVVYSIGPVISEGNNRLSLFMVWIRQFFMFLFYIMQ